MKLRWNDRIWKRTQAVLLWVIGAAGIVNELFIEKAPRPYAWPIIGALIGGPFALEFDRQRRSVSPPPVEPSPPDGHSQSHGEARG